MGEGDGGTNGEGSTETYSLPSVKYMSDVSEVAQLCPTLCDPLDCSLPGS